MEIDVCLCVFSLRTKRTILESTIDTSFLPARIAIKI